MSRRKTLRRAAFCVCAAVFAVCVFLLGRTYFGMRRTEQSVDKLREVLENAQNQVRPPQSGEPQPQQPAVRPGLSELREQNGDLQAWICIPGTSVDYPVMQTGTNDPEHYLRRGFDGTYDFNGLPFADARCSFSPRSDLLIVYGHSIRTGIMFSDLLSYKEYDFWQQHKTVTLDTLQGSESYEICAAFLYDATSGQDAFKPHAAVDFDSEQAFEEYVGQALALSYYDTGARPQWGDRLLLLVTCDRRLLDEGRMVLLCFAPS